MPMTIMLEVSSELEAKLREGIARRDTEHVYQLLVNAFTPTVETLLQEASAFEKEEEFELLADQLADKLAANFESDVPQLSNYAVSRASIYEDYA
jgi:antitoxin ParD1/3/4